MVYWQVPVLWIAVPIVLTSALSILVHRLFQRWDGVLLALSGALTLVVAYFTVSALWAIQSGLSMSAAMSHETFMLGVVNPAFVVGTIALWRGLFKIF